GPGRQPPAEPPSGGPVALTPPPVGPTTSVFPPDPATVQPPSGPSPIFHTLTPPGSPPAQSDLAAADLPRPPTERSLPGGSTGEQYNYAFGLLKQADYPAAEAALKAFVEQHPRDPMAGNAQYWAQR